MTNAPIFSVGPFVAALEYAADCHAEVVGKPEAAFFTAAISDLDVRPEECVMIGDASVLFFRFCVYNARYSFLFSNTLESFYSRM